METSGQVREEAATSVHRYTVTPRANRQVELTQGRGVTALRLGTKVNGKKVDAALADGAQAGAYTRHFSAQRKRFPWDIGCLQGLFRGCSWGCTAY